MFIVLAQPLQGLVSDHELVQLLLLQTQGLQHADRQTDP